MWILQAENSDNERLTFRVMAGATKTVGRATQADFILASVLVSRIHCRLTAQPTGELQVEDLRSTNGTYVNDRRIGSAQLEPGDKLRLGRAEFTVERRGECTA